ncbi:MAG: S9 family peptidase [Bacillota bacterium]|nr:MAG: S9 family peptidase [Bacillota bacterium]
MAGSPNRYPFERFHAVRRVVGFTPAPDGESVYVVTDISGQLNLWRVPTAGGAPQQLTLFERESVRAVACSRDGRQLAFIADPDGNEQYQVYWMAADGWPEKLTDRPTVQHDLGPGAFSPDGRYLAYSANARTPTEVDVYLRDLGTGEERMVLGGGGWYGFDSFDPAGRRLLAIQFYGNMDQDIWLVDLESGRRENLTAHPGREANYWPVAWRPDGQGFYYLTNDGREFLALGYYDLAGGRRELIIAPDWDVEGAALSPDGRLLAYVVNEAGQSVLRVRDLGTGEELPLPPLPRGVVRQVAFAPADRRRRLFLLLASYRQAGTVCALDLETGELRELVDTMLGRIPPEDFVEPELVHIPSFDGLQIPAWLYRPQGIAPGERVPALLSIHGGPESQERPEYNYTGFYQYLLSRGIAILAPNIRGSTGFGKSYQRKIYRDWGGGDLKDIEACARYLQFLPWVDPQRLGVWGGSYGGFATLSAVTRLPQYWACGCELVGPANLVTFTRTVPPHWRAVIKELIGDPEEDREMLLERSPITYVENVRCPLMIVQGANDPRVVKAESDQMVERLRSLGREVEYLVFEDEGHGFAKRSNRIRGMTAMADFLIRHLVGAGA